MKILALVTDGYGADGGIAQANRDLFEALRGRHELVVMPRRGRPIPPGGATQRKALRPRALYSAAAITEAASRRYDAVLCGHLFMAPLAAAAASLKGSRLWLHIHGIEAWPRPGGVVRWAAERARLVTAVSRCTRERFLAWAAVEPERVKVLPDTYAERFAPGPRDEALAKKYGFSGKKTILTVGRLSSRERYKGHDRVIRALPRVLATHPDAVYLVAGEGDDRGRLETLVRSGGLEGRVVFAGRVPDEELPRLYRSADVFAMPSTGEGFGIVFLEAAASGVPVVGGGTDGSLDALREGRLGDVVDPDDAAALAAALVRRLSGPAPSRPELETFRAENQRAHAARLVDAYLCEGR